MSDVSRDGERAVEFVRRYGWNPTAVQTLSRGYSYFFHEDNGCVAYIDTGAAWVAAGAPIAATGALTTTSSAFVSAAERVGRRSCFFAAEDRLRRAAGRALRSLKIGEQPAWDPRAWPAVVARTRSLREQFRRARAKGVVVREASVAELTAGHTRDGVARVAERWLSTRGMAPMGFLVRLDPFGLPDFRRCFVAERDGTVVAFASVLPVPAREGWYVENVVRDPIAPNGTGEVLVDAVMRSAMTEGSTWLTLGLAPLAGVSAAPLRLARASTRPLYDFDGLRAYKAKLRPGSWTSVYLCHPTTQGPTISTLDALTAFTDGGLLKFGALTLARGARRVGL